MNSRSLRRLANLANAGAAAKGDERALILRTLLKILDECSDAEYEVAYSEPLKAKLIAAGVEFDAEE
jgi:hypothetical protein